MMIDLHSKFTKSVWGVFNRTTMFFVFLFFTFNLIGQQTDQKNADTDVLLLELNNKVNQIKKIKTIISEDKFKNSVEKENIQKDLSSAERDLLIFIDASLYERVVRENRLKDVATIVQPINEKLSIKFLILDQENNSAK